VNRLAANDDEAYALASTRSQWFIPLVNPDGYYMNYIKLGPHGGGFQRKNTRPGCKITDSDGTGVGVDLNRNYGTCWNRDQMGSSSNVCAEDYCGTAAFSEPETQAIKTFVETYRITISLNYHSFGRDLNTLPGCKDGLKLTSDAQVVVSDVATQLTAENHYEWGPPWNLPGLYPVNGDAADWMYAAHGIIAMSPEVSPLYPAQTTELGFWPLEADIVPFAIENIDMNKHTAWFAAQWYILQSAVSSGGNNDIIVQTAPSGSFVDANKNQCSCNSQYISAKVFNRGLAASQGSVVMVVGAAPSNSSALALTLDQTSPPVCVSKGKLDTRQTSDTMNVCIPSRQCAAGGAGLSTYIAVFDDAFCQVWRLDSKGVAKHVATSMASGVCATFVNSGAATATTTTVPPSTTTPTSIPTSCCGDNVDSGGVTTVGVLLSLAFGLSVSYYIIKRFIIPHFANRRNYAGFSQVRGDIEMQ
jgi:hypothetical protein